jgi:hypothetical protein
MESITGRFRAGTAGAGQRQSGAGLGLKEDGKRLLILKLFVFLSEPFDATGRIHQLLLAGKKRMAIGANFHAYILFGGTRLDGVAAGALDSCLVIIRMDICFHFNFNPLHIFLSIH